MAYSHTRALYEAHLARAHRAIFRAEECADELGDQGAAYDCRMIGREIFRLAEDSLRERPKKRNVPVDDCA